MSSHDLDADANNQAVSPSAEAAAFPVMNYSLEHLSEHLGHMGEDEHGFPVGQKGLSALSQFEEENNNQETEYLIGDLVFNEPDSPSNQLLDDSNNLKAGTFAKIIERLTHPYVHDSNFLYDFVLTYRSFATPFQVVDALVKRYETAPEADNKAVLLRILNVLKHWIEKCWYDFYKNCPELSDRCTAFLDVCAENPAIRTVALSLKHKLARKLQVQLESERVAPSAPRHQSLSTAAPKEAPLLGQNSEEIARQLTLIEWSIWEQIQPWECLGLSWTKKNKDLAPHVLELIDRFNLVSGWVATVVCTQELLKKRIKHVQKFIEIGFYLCNMGNFNAVMEITSGLNRGPVYRLRQTWDGLTTQLRKNFEQLSQIVDRSKSYANMRRCLRSVNPPCIPYLGMYLTDLMFIEEGNRDALNGLINWNKRHQISETIRAIKQYQQQPYQFQPVPSMQEMLKSIQTLSEDELYQISEWLEPRPGKERGARPTVLGEPKLRRHQTSSTTSSLSSGLFGSSSTGSSGSTSWLGAAESEALDFELDFDENDPFAAPDSPANLELDPTTNSIRAATLPKLIERLTHHANPDSNSLFSFLATFQSFATPIEVLDLLIARFHVPPPKDKSPAVLEKHRCEYETPISLRVFNLLKTWIDRHFYHFQEDPELRVKLEAFVQGPFREKQPRFSETLRAAIQRQLAPPSQQMDAECPKQVVPEQVTGLADLDAHEVARQLCLLHHAPFAAIKSQGLLDASASLTNRQEDPPNVSALLNAYKHVRHWVNFELTNPELREANVLGVLAKWIEIAEACSDNRNLLATRAIVHSLDSYRQRSPATFSRLPAASIAYFEKECRDLLYQFSVKIQLSPPCIPVIRDYLIMLRECQDQHQPDLFDDKINFEKCRALGEILQVVSRLQRFRYAFFSVPIIQAYIAKFSLPDASSDSLSCSLNWSVAAPSGRLPDEPRLQDPLRDPEPSPSAPSTAASLSSQYMFCMIDSLNKQRVKREIHAMAQRTVAPYESFLKHQLKAVLTGSTADLSLSQLKLNASPLPPSQPPPSNPSLPRASPPAVDHRPKPPYHHPTAAAADGHSPSPPFSFSGLSLAASAHNWPPPKTGPPSSAPPPPFDQTRQLVAADAPSLSSPLPPPPDDAIVDQTLLRIADGLLTTEFPDSQRVHWAGKHPKTGKPFVVQIIERGNRKFLCDIRPYVDLEDIANLLVLGKQYKHEYPNDLLACIILTRDISPVALEKTNQYKIKVHKI